MRIKKIYKDILIITGKILFLSFALVSMAFVNNEYKKKKIENINIKIISDNQPMMCSVEDIEQYIQKNNFDLLNKLYYETNFYQIEKILNEKNEVKKTDVYFTPDKQLCVQIKERKPIARIFTKTFNYYIDDEWKIFKVTHTYKVPLIIGEIYENPALFKHYSISKITSFPSLAAVSVFDDIYISLNHLLSDSTLYNFTDYLYINKDKEIAIYPNIGKIKINVGSSEHFAEKMNKLKIFIQYGLNKNDAWNKYSDINLKYQNLIYCTKK
ncbi:MAG: cell division protein FtsQ [Bacteroidia bacterium]